MWINMHKNTHSFPQNLPKRPSLFSTRWKKLPDTLYVTTDKLVAMEIFAYRITASKLSGQISNLIPHLIVKAKIRWQAPRKVRGVPLLHALQHRSQSILESRRLCVLFSQPATPQINQMMIDRIFMLACERQDLKFWWSSNGQQVLERFYHDMFHNSGLTY